MDLNNNKRGSLKNLQDHKTGFDKEAMWAALEQKEEKKRFPFWWWFGGSALAIAAVGMIWFFNNQEGISKNELVEVNQQLAVTHQANSEQIVVENRVGLTENTQEEKGQTATSTKSKIISPSGNEVANDFITKIERIPTNAPPIGSTYVPATTTNGFEVNQTHSTKVEKKEVVNDLKSTTYEVEAKKEEEITQRDFQEAFAFLPSGKSQFLPLELNPRAPKIRKRSRKTAGFKIGVYGGYGTHFNVFGGKGDNINSQAVIFRKENENPLDNFTVGVLIEKNIFKRFSLKTGIEWTQLNDKVVITSSRFGHVNDFDSGEIPAQFRGRPGFLKAIDNHIFYNQIRQLNLPLTLAYELPFGRFSIKPEAGVIFNLSNVATGDLLTNEHSTTDLNYFYKKNVGMSYRLGLESGFYLTNRTKVFASPIYTLGSSDWTNGWTGVSHGVAQIRLDLGLVRRF